MTNLRLMTLNILTDGLYNFGDSRFIHRAEALKEMINTEDPGLIGVQEFTEKMKPHLADVFDGYGFTGESRGSLFTDEYSPILYKKERFELLDSGTFWLSDTPGKRGSKFALSQFPRIVTMAYLRDKESGKVISFYNTHLDHNLTVTRTKQAKVLAMIIQKTGKGSAAFVTGDFNAVPGSEPVSLIEASGLKDLVTDDIGSTLKGKIGSAIQKQRPIDHIFVSGDPALCSVTKLDQKYAGYYPSDHFPLIASVQY